MRKRLRLPAALSTGFACVSVLLTGIAIAQPQVVPLGNGNISVDMDGCSVLFNSRGGIESEGRDCRAADVRDARNAFDSYQREQGASDAEAPPGGFGAATPQLVPLGNGNVSVDMAGCSVLFNERGSIESQGRDCGSADVRTARDAFERYQREQNASDRDEAPPGGFGGNTGSSEDGITAYRDTNYGGSSESFRGDIANLSGTRVGNDSISSIRVPSGCRVTVYGDTDFRGRSSEYTSDVADLGRTSVGNDQISSMRVDCGRGSGGGSVTLFSDTNFGGTSESISSDVAQFSRTRIGNDQLSSIRVPRGCEATLYSDYDFGGNSIRIDGDESDLGRTRIGNDQVSSIRVDCR